jgi:hypothetical protein
MCRRDEDLNDEPQSPVFPVSQRSTVDHLLGSSALAGRRPVRQNRRCEPTIHSKRRYRRPPKREVSSERWFYINIAVLMILLNVVAFGTSIIDPAERRVPLPLSLLVTIHAIVSALWLVLFLTQATLIATTRTAVHRRLGVIGAVLAVVFVVLGVFSVVEQARRGFDLSGDIGRVPLPPPSDTLGSNRGSTFLLPGVRNISRRSLLLPTSSERPQAPDAPRRARRADAYTRCTYYRPLAEFPAMGGLDLPCQLRCFYISECDLRPGIGGPHPSGVAVRSNFRGWPCGSSRCA